MWDHFEIYIQALQTLYPASLKSMLLAIANNDDFILEKIIQTRIRFVILGRFGHRYKAAERPWGCLPLCFVGEQVYDSEFGLEEHAYLIKSKKIKTLCVNIHH